MDPLTQGLLGATAAANSRLAKAPRAVALGLGFLGGLAADPDVLLRSTSDPLLFLPFPRQSTHSLVFIPRVGLP